MNQHKKSCTGAPPYHPTSSREHTPYTHHWIAAAASLLLPASPITPIPPSSLQPLNGLIDPSQLNPTVPLTGLPDPHHGEAMIDNTATIVTAALQPLKT